MSATAARKRTDGAKKDAPVKRDADYAAAIEESNAKLDELNIEGWEWRIEIVPVDQMYMGRYQRPLDERWLKKRDDDFKPWMLGTVTLSERHHKGMRFATVDGQHRRELAIRHGVSYLAAVVFYNLTEAQEAALFSAFQRERRNITPYQRHYADLISGDPRAKTISRVVSEEGWVLKDSGATHSDFGSIKAVRLLENIYDEDPAMLRTVLRVVRATWSGLPYSNNERVLRGVWAFLRENPDFDEHRFTDRLGSVTPSTLLDRGAKLREGRGGGGRTLPQFIAEAIENSYRSRRR